MPASPVFFGRRERQGWGGAGRGQRQKSACVLPHGGAEARLLGPNPACSPHRLGASLSAPRPGSAVGTKGPACTSASGCALNSCVTGADVQSHAPGFSGKHTSFREHGQV